ncbi:hypothetical protein OG871_36025 [Kitasatospora sp. NBC_00374]|uniref:hypothetical protein n=1 Tax=Kitasatospora sp. NBC_00374 TaxID=2975964 RepID=UPI0030E3618C
MSLRNRIAASAAAAVAAFGLGTGCTAGNDVPGGEARPATASAPASPREVQLLSGGALAHALLTDQEARTVGYGTNGDRRIEQEPGQFREPVVPESCRPLQGTSPHPAQVSASMNIHKLGSVLVIRSIGIGRRSAGEAEAHLASLRKALDDCPTMSVDYADGAPVEERKTTRLPDVTAGDESLSYLQTWTNTVGGRGVDHAVAVTVVRCENITVTVMSIGDMPSSLTPPEKAAQLPVNDEALVRLQSDKVRALLDA